MSTSLLASLKAEFDKTEDAPGGSDVSWKGHLYKVEMTASTENKMSGKSVKEAHQNAALNRYTNILPFDDNVVTIGEEKKYLNASLIDVRETGEKYIATQGPLENTSSDMWEMVWERKVDVIVMLNKWFEDYNCKCWPYYPEKELSDQSIVRSFPPFTISLMEETPSRVDKEERDYVYRKLRVTKDDCEESREVHHLQYMSWPDHSVPASTTPMLDFMRLYWKMRDESNGSVPVVHCSAGVGRTGVFISIDSWIKAIEKPKVQEISWYKTVVRLRGMRGGMVQTYPQLRFAYKTVLDYFAESPVTDDPSLDVSTLDKGDADALPVGALETPTDDASSAVHRNNDIINKRRVKVALMVAKSRAAERRGTGLAYYRNTLRERLNSSWGRSVAAASTVAIAAALFMYYKS